ncbi:Hsp33 family molecular chaperone HslO [Thermomonas sp. HDW16]|uniref:Hsp33 family molecular chaperone HslO n=1 Tax=Thermomonas sp. HDW16 TaxID=2714945 RepID=UPI001409CF0A|nr:Hsp33 family molecular chaperone HslO [Thermomonas sp. HDW16]
MTQTHDTQLRFLLPTAGVRGVAVRLDDTWQTMAARALYPPAVAELLGEATAAAALFTGHAKIDGRLSVQLRSQGALRTLFAECTAVGTLRGIAQFDEDAPAPSRDLRALGADAMLAITIENPSLGGRDPIRYQGLVELDADNLGEAFEGYFRQSEQLPTRLLLACDGKRSAGLMLQKLPGDGGDDDGWNRASALFETLGSEELLALPPAELIHRLFHEESPEAMGEKPLRFACSCSRERVAAMLVSLGTDEAAAAVESGGGEAQVRCEFCGQDYRFGEDEIASLFREAAAQLPAAPGIQ